MFSNKSAPFFPLLPLCNSYLSPGSRKILAAVVYGDPLASRAGSDDSELCRLIMVIKQKVKPETLCPCRAAVVIVFYGRSVAALDSCARGDEKLEI